MLNIAFRFVLFLLLMSACNEPGKERVRQKDTDGNRSKGSAIHPAGDAGPADTAHPVPESKDKGDSVITLLANEKEAALSAIIQKDYQQIHIQVPVTNTRHLAVQLKPEGRERNVRISQIEMPDGKTDGPFGADMEYTTKKEGTYTLIIARNNMAEGIVRGPVQIFIKRD